MSRDGMPPVSRTQVASRLPAFLLDDDSDDIALLIGPAPTAAPVAAAAAAAAAAPAPASHEYTAQDFATNCENQYFRYVPNSEKISHLLLRRRTNEALQFAIPHPTGVPEVPVVKPLQAMFGFTLPNGKDAFQGIAADGETMISRRHYDLEITQGAEPPEAYTFYPLSPKKDKPGFFGPTPIKRFLDSAEAKRVMESTEIYCKATGELEIINADIPKRAEIKTRKPDQNTVMGGKNAVSAYEDFLKKYGHLLTEDLKKLLKESAETPWKSSNIPSQKRPEWLHRHGFRLHPMAIDPQRVDNLGSARKCHNTAMMIPERTVERMIQKYPEAKAKICCSFTMLLDSEVVNTIYFYVLIQVGQFKVRLTQKIDALEKNPQFVKASDMASIVGILCMMLQNIAPVRTQHVNILSYMPRIAHMPTLFARPQDAAGQKRERDDTLPAARPAQPH